MSKELLTPKLTADLTYYAVIYNENGQVFNGTTFETFVDANYATYDVALAELGTSSGRYAADLPAALSATTRYSYEVFRQVGGSPSLSGDFLEAQGELGLAKSDALAIDGITANATALGRFAENVDRAGKCITHGTVGVGSTTTNVVTSSLSPAASVTDQFKALILGFPEDTTTVALRGQKTRITGSTATGELAVETLTTAPASGDVFVIE